MMFGPTSYATIALLLEKNISIFAAGELACFSAWQPHLLPRGLNMFHKSWMLKRLYQHASNTYIVKRPDQCSQKGFSLVPISSRTCLSSTTAGICKFSLTITILTSSKKKEKNEPFKDISKYCYCWRVFSIPCMASLMLFHDVTSYISIVVQFKDPGIRLSLPPPSKYSVHAGQSSALYLEV